MSLCWDNEVDHAESCCGGQQCIKVHLRVVSISVNLLFLIVDLFTGFLTLFVTLSCWVKESTIIHIKGQSIVVVPFWLKKRFFFLPHKNSFSILFIQSPFIASLYLNRSLIFSLYFMSSETIIIFYKGSNNLMIMMISSISIFTKN